MAYTKVEFKGNGSKAESKNFSSVMSFSWLGFSSV